MLTKTGRQTQRVPQTGTATHPIWCSHSTRPDTRLPKSCTGGQGEYNKRLIKYLGRGCSANNVRKRQKSSVTDQPTKERTDRQTDLACYRVACTRLRTWKQCASNKYADFTSHSHLQVSVNDVSLVKEIHGRNDLIENPPGVRFRNETVDLELHR